MNEYNTTLQSHIELNPKIWVGSRLRPEVRSKLLRFAEAFGTFCKVPPSLVKDVILVGGSAGYNWTPFSDIDVHLVVDRKALGPTDLVDEYLNSKKQLWPMWHNVTVRGLPLEGYVQDPSEHSPAGQGVYSIRRSKWLQRPEHNTHSWTTDKAFEAKVESLRGQIEHMIDTRAPLEDFEALKTRIANMRRAGLMQGGEYNIDNEVFKELRNSKSLERMFNHIKSREDEDLSLK